MLHESVMRIRRTCLARLLGEEGGGGNKQSESNAS